MASKPVNAQECETKYHALLNLLHSNKRTTVKQIQTITGWQQHSAPGLFIRNRKEKLCLRLESKEGRGSERCCAEQKS